MSGWGSSETDKLRAMVESQLDRLLAQLQDLEDLKDELEEEEIEDIREDTLEQMNEFEATLNRLMSGDMSLVDSLGAMRIVCCCFFFFQSGKFLRVSFLGHPSCD